METIALIQARMGSSRYPGKTLEPVLGKPLLEWQLERLLRSRYLTKIVVATSTLEKDTPIAEFCRNFSARSPQIDCFRGSESDVLQRFYDAASKFVEPEKRDGVVLLRLTGDCPLTDPFSIDQGISRFRELRERGCRYLGYDPNLPDGMDFEVFCWSALEQAQREAKDPFEREHVTPYMWKNPTLFAAEQFKKSGIAPDLRFSVDYPEDQRLVEAIFQIENERGTILGMESISELLTTNPKLAELNSHIIKNEGLIITSLKSPAFQTKIEAAQLRVPYFGIFLGKNLCDHEPGAETRDMLAWAQRIGIRIVGAQTNLSWGAWENLASGVSWPGEFVIWQKSEIPQSWQIFSMSAAHASVTDDDKRKLAASAKLVAANISKNAEAGILLETHTRPQLASLLMYVCQGQFLS